jgi:molecular chaperone GrpE
VSDLPSDPMRPDPGEEATEGPPPEDIAGMVDPTGAPTVEELAAELEAVIAQRDEYLALAQAKQAEFENFRKRMMKQQAEEVTRAASKLVEELLPVLDAFDYGVAHGDDSLAPMRAQLLAALEREGLVRLVPDGAPFDPNEHDAVAHEPGDGDVPTVAETLRAGYRWQGHLLRPVMVRVRD